MCACGVCGGVYVGVCEWVCVSGWVCMCVCVCVCVCGVCVCVCVCVRCVCVCGVCLRREKGGGRYTIDVMIDGYEMIQSESTLPTLFNVHVKVQIDNAYDHE